MDIWLDSKKNKKYIDKVWILLYDLWYNTYV